MKLQRVIHLITLIVLATLVGCGGRRTELDAISDGQVDVIRKMLDLPSEVPDSEIRRFCEAAQDEFGSFTEANDAEIVKLHRESFVFTEVVATLLHPGMPVHLEPSPHSTTFLRASDGQFGKRVFLMQEQPVMKVWGIQLLKSRHD